MKKSRDSDSSGEESEASYKKNPEIIDPANM